MIATPASRAATAGRSYLLESSESECHYAERARRKLRAPRLIFKLIVMLFFSVQPEEGSRIAIERLIDFGGTSSVMT